MAYYPIVYIRGYAMTPSEVEDTFNKPYYGFNLGSTQIRLSREARPTMRIFESPVLRLLEHEQYLDSFNKFVTNRNVPIKDSVAVHEPKVDWRRTLWIFRFYDPESKLQGEGERKEIEHYAEELANFLNQVRLACGNPQGFKVILVAHSMGGLIARCYLQNKKLDAALRRKKQVVLVDKLFTYGTPHRGITFRTGLGWVEDIRDLIGYRGMDTFGPGRMSTFLSLPKKAELNTFVPARKNLGDLDVDRIFCIVGTNYQDYVVWGSKQAVGPGSDGLVAIENAYVKDAPSAYVHRAHSGPFGIVNSEEGYQNLIRFLFGNFRYKAFFEPISLRQHLPGLRPGDTLDFLEINVDITLRGLPSYIHVRRELDESSIIVRMRSGKKGGVYPQEKAERTPLYTGYLRKDQKRIADTEDPFLRGAIQLRVMPHYAHDGWIRDSRYEGESILNDRLHVGVLQKGKKIEVEYRWAMESDQPQPLSPQRDGTFLFPLPQAAQRYIQSEGIRVEIAPWE